MSLLMLKLVPRIVWIPIFAQRNYVAGETTNFVTTFAIATTVI